MSTVLQAANLGNFLNTFEAINIGHADSVK